MADGVKATNITWHDGSVTRDEREKKNGHKSVVIWYTGLSGSGKSTLANAVAGALFEQGCQTYVLDGDNVRHGLNKNLGFSPEDREENIRRIGEVAKIFCDAGVIAMTAFISPYRKDRDEARAISADSFVEVFPGAEECIIIDTALKQDRCQTPHRNHLEDKSSHLMVMIGLMGKSLLSYKLLQ